jgi:hypothetical protein
MPARKHTPHRPAPKEFKLIMPVFSRSARTFFRAPLAGASLIAVLVLAAPVALAAAITGTVTNRTNGKPSAGDTVTLIRLAQGMQEAAHATSDSHGHYTLDVTDSDAMHLIRVTHQGANYFQPVPPGTSNADVDVYDAAPKVAGVSLEADVLRIESNGGSLHVIESFFIKNDSAPPRTQMSAHPFEFYIPAGAQITGSAALGPGGMPVQSAPVPMGDPGHYTFIFPLRPGETRLQLSYQLPYSGALAFTPKFAMAVDNYAILLPKSMQFAPATPASFQSVNEDTNAQTYLVKNVKPGVKLAFKVAGSGQLPQETDANGQSSGGTQASGPMQEGQSGSASAANDTRPGGGLGTPIDTPDPLNKYKWWILAVVGALLAAGAGILLRQSPQSSGAASATASANVSQGSVLLLALKEELFALETERIEGKISQPEYDRIKVALETVLQRALSRQPRKTPPSTS